MTIKLSDLKKQSDAVWSSRDVNEIEDFKPSRLLSLLNSESDLSSLNSDLINQAENFSEELCLSHLRANLVRAFDWSDCASVLEIGAQAGAITRYLAEQQLAVDAIEDNRALAQVAAYRTDAFPNVRIICEPYPQLDFEAKRYDVIVLAGITDLALSLTKTTGISYSQAVSEFLSGCQQLLTPEGKILLVADNNQGIKYAFGAIDERSLKPYSAYLSSADRRGAQTLNLVQWRSLLGNLNFAQMHEHYLWPDYRFAKVLLGHDYVSANKYSFQHLEGVPSVDYHHPLDIGVSEYLIYQTLTNNGHLGEFANSLLYILSNKKDPINDRCDFVHFPDYKRRSPFLSLVKKQAGESSVKRINLHKNPSPGENDTKQVLDPEAYIPGAQLSTLWLRSILHDPGGIEFEQYLLDYFDYLKKLDSGVFAGMNIDAVANNIVVDEQGNYQLIDREWQQLDLEIDAVLVFYRAMVQFSMRNDSIYHQFKWMHSLSTLTDFLIYSFKIIGIDPKIGDLEKLRMRDLEFSKRVLKQVQPYDLSDPFGHFVAPVKAITFVSWRYTDEYDYADAVKTVCEPTAGHDTQQLVFRLPEDERKVACFRFFPFQHLKSPIAGYFTVDSIKFNIVDQFKASKLHWSLDSSDEINRANLHQGVFFAQKDSESVFMFNNNDTFLEFELPSYDLAQNENAQVEISFRLKQSHDYEIAREKYALVERQMNEKLALREDEFKMLNKEVNKLNKELSEVRASRVWRLLSAYRDSFKHSGYPPKNFIGKFKQMINRFRRGDLE